MNLLKHTIWAIAAIVVIAVIAMETKEYSVEEEKQKAFMMKACVEAGGDWKRGWGPNWDCVRPIRVGATNEPN